MENIFSYFETLNSAEREAVAAELVNMYNGLLLSEQETFAALCSASGKDYRDIQLRYMSASGSLGTLQGVFELLGIPFEYGQPIEH